MKLNTPDGLNNRVDKGMNDLEDRVTEVKLSKRGIMQHENRELSDSIKWSHLEDEEIAQNFPRLRKEMCLLDPGSTNSPPPHTHKKPNRGSPQGT